MQFLSRKGFTLVEVMIVIAIIGILVATLFPSYTYYIHSTKEKVVKIGIQRLLNQAQEFYAMKGYHYNGNQCVNITTNMAQINTTYPNYGWGGCSNNSAADNIFMQQYFWDDLRQLILKNLKTSLDASAYTFRGTTDPPKSTIALYVALTSTTVWCGDSLGYIGVASGVTVANLTSAPTGKCQ